MSDRDWEAFALLAINRHRVAPIAQQGLLRLRGAHPPAAVRDVMEKAVEANAIQVLHQIAALRAIRQAFDQANLPFTVLKGWPLAEQLFNNSNARQARDIDLIVDRTSLPEAANLMNTLGYQPPEDHPEHHQMIGSDALIDEINNLGFFHPESGLSVELHWRSNQFKGWPELFEGGAGSVRLDTAIGPINVPSEQHNLIYLSIHGSMHRWSRLKWLCDIAALAERRGRDQLQDDISAARRAKAGRALELALHLANRILGSPCPGTRYSQQSWLPAQCLGEIARDEAVPGDISHRLKFYAMMLRLAESPSQVAGIVRYRLWGKTRLGLQAHRLAA